MSQKTFYLSDIPKDSALRALIFGIYSLRLVHKRTDSNDRALFHKDFWNHPQC